MHILIRTFNKHLCLAITVQFKTNDKPLIKNIFSTYGYEGGKNVHKYIRFKEEKNLNIFIK